MYYRALHCTPQYYVVHPAPSTRRPAPEQFRIRSATQDQIQGGGSDPGMRREDQIQQGRIRSRPGGSDPAWQDQIQARRIRSRPRTWAWPPWPVWPTWYPGCSGAESGSARIGPGRFGRPGRPGRSWGHLLSSSAILTPSWASLWAELGWFQGGVKVAPGWHQGGSRRA